MQTASPPAAVFPGLLLPAAEPSPPRDTKLICINTVYGDTLWGIARLFGTTVADIARLNAISDPDVLFPGRRLYLRVPASLPIAACERYTVRPGDTLYGVARRFGLDAAALAERNGLFDPDLILPGQVLQLDVPQAL